MSKIEMKLGAVSIDCEDPDALVDFYARLTGSENIFRSDGFAAVKVGAVWFAMHRVEGYRAPAWPSGDPPKQVHFDLAVDDLDAAQEHAVSVGARLPGEQPAPDRWRVLLDPAGHPFCLSPAAMFP